MSQFKHSVTLLLCLTALLVSAPRASAYSLFSDYINTPYAVIPVPQDFGTFGGGYFVIDRYEFDAPSFVNSIWYVDPTGSSTSLFLQIPFDNSVERRDINCGQFIPNDPDAWGDWAGKLLITEHDWVSYTTHYTTIDAAGSTEVRFGIQNYASYAGFRHFAISPNDFGFLGNQLFTMDQALGRVYQLNLNGTLNFVGPTAGDGVINSGWGFTFDTSDSPSLWVTNLNDDGSTPNITAMSPDGTLSPIIHLNSSLGASGYLEGLRNLLWTNPGFFPDFPDDPLLMVAVAGSGGSGGTTGDVVALHYDALDNTWDKVGSFKATTPGLDLDPRGMALTPDGDLLVADIAQNGVLLLSASDFGAYVDPIQPPDDGPLSITAPHQLTAIAGTTFEFNVQVTNNSDGYTDYDLTNDGGLLFSDTFSSQTSAYLDAAASAMHTVMVDPSATFAPGDYLIDFTLSPTFPSDDSISAATLLQVVLSASDTLQIMTNESDKGVLINIGNYDWQDRKTATAEITSTWGTGDGWNWQDLYDALPAGTTIAQDEWVQADVGFDSSGKLNGKHWGYAQISFQNDQSLLGATPDDTGGFGLYLLAQVTGNTDSGSAQINLDDPWFEPLSIASTSGITLATLLDVQLTQSATVTMSIVDLDDPRVYGDAVELSGLDNQVFVLQLSYDPSLIDPADLHSLALGWMDGDTWVIAVDGNSYADPHFVLGAYSSELTSLGYFGHDVLNHTVWAVLDHNSLFAVIPTSIPEPASLLLLLSAAALTRRKN